MRDFTQLIDGDIFIQMLLQIADALIEHRFFAGADMRRSGLLMIAPPGAGSAAAASGFAEAAPLPDNNPAAAR